MKKLIPMVAAVAGTLSAFAGGLNTTMTFDEGFALGDKITGQTTDADGNVYWKVNEDAETGTITNEVPYSAESGNYLDVDTADAFYRHANAVGDSGVDIAEAKGVFVDTMLKFTLSEESDQTLDKDAQFGLWLAAPEENGPTNIWIKMGSVNEAGTITPTNIAIGVANAIDPNAWHRVTIRSIANINQRTGSPLVGYVVFIDGNETPLAYQGDDYAALIDPEVVKDAAAKGYYEKKQLFVGLVNAAQLTAVGFKGMGSTDDIMISDFENAPLFAKGKMEFKVMWNPDAIASIVINGNTEDNDGECIVALTDSTKVTVEATAAEGYEVAEKIEWTWAADFVEAEIPVKKINFTAGGNNYESLTAAIEAGETSIAVAANTAETVANMIAINSGNVVIDLNGKTFTVTGEDYCIFDVEGGALTVIDSVGGGALVANSEVEGFGVFYGTDITIGAAEGDEGATFIGNLAFEGTEMVINKGLFDKASNTTADAFTYADAAADGTEVTEAGDYWKVDVKGGETEDDWPEDPTQVAGETAEEAFPNVEFPEEIKDVPADALTVWAKDVGNVDFKLAAEIIPEAFILNCENTPAGVAAAKEAFKVTADDLSTIMKAAPEDVADSLVKAYEEKYPNAKVTVVEITEGALKSTENAKFWKLTLTFK